MGEERTTRMKTATNTRRRPSATSTTSTGQLNPEEARGLLRNNESSSRDGLSESFEIRKDDNTKRDYSKWLRPFGLVFSILLLATIAIASLITVLHNSPPDILNFLHLGNNGAENLKQRIAIELYPYNHVFRAPKTIAHHWTITSGFLYPDGVKKEVYLVNGQFPGPTIECRSGDKLVIHVTNDLPSEGVSIHWHGLDMRDANSMDGAVGFTQCPIFSGGKFIYEFDISGEQSGTFWWHAHSQVERGDGMYGGLVIHKPHAIENEMKKYAYEKEVLLLIGDWYHKSAQEVLGWYTSTRGFGNEVRFTLLYFLE